MGNFGGNIGRNSRERERRGERVRVRERGQQSLESKDTVIAGRISGGDSSNMSCSLSTPTLYVLNSLSLSSFLQPSLSITSILFAHSINL